MDKAVIYYNKGTKCIQRLLVSIFSLRKHYKGRIILALEGEHPEWFLQIIDKFKVEINRIREEDVRALVRKAHLWQERFTKYNMFIDADTLILKPIDKFFDHIAEHGFTTTSFADWRADKQSIAKRILQFGITTEQDVGPAIQGDYPAVNTGVFGWQSGRDIDFLLDWAKLSLTGTETFIPDEMACQILQTKHKISILDHSWNYSAKHSKDGDPHIIHYHGRKHVHDFPLCKLWKQTFWELYYKLSKNKRKHFKSYLGDRRLRKYFRSLKDLTIVTAATPGKYLKKLLHSLPKWMEIEGLFEYPITCFINDISEKDLPHNIRKRVEFINWDLDVNSRREKMLSAFVLGAAEQIQTKHWLKIDADYVPSVDKLEFSEEAWAADIAGRAWSYTKPGSMLADVEDWANHKIEFTTAPLYSKEEIEKMHQSDKYHHKRIISKICLHKSKFVRECAKMVSQRLPIPSHDTYLWYIAERLNRPRLRFKI